MQTLHGDACSENYVYVALHVFKRLGVRLSNLRRSLINQCLHLFLMITYPITTSNKTFKPSNFILISMFLQLQLNASEMSRDNSANELPLLVVKGNPSGSMADVS